MFKPGSWPLAALLALPLALTAQDAENQALTLPKDPEVNRIEAVPAPEIPMGAGAAEGLELPDHLQIDNQGGQITGDPKTGIRFGGPVKISGDSGLEAFARTAVLDLQKKTVTLEGEVSIYQGDVMKRGDRAVYFYEEKRLMTDGMRASYDPALLESGKFSSRRIGGRDVLVGEDAGVTTHDVENPGYWIRSSETRIYPEEKITFRNMRITVGDTPVFWLPYLAQPLDSELGYHFLPGAKTAWGPYLLNTYGVMLGGDDGDDTGLADYEEPWLLSRWHFDIRGKRGLGFGLDLADIHSDRNDDITGLSLYYMHDQQPEFSRTGLPRTFNEEERYKLQLRHRMRFKDWEPDAEWRLDTNLSYFSDQFYLLDLEEDIYTSDPAPDNTIALFRRSDQSLLSLYTRYQVNDFYRADSRLPELVFDIARQPLFDLPLLHEGTFSVGWLGERADDLTKNSIIDPLSGMTIGTPGAAELLGELTGYERLLAEAMVALPPGDTVGREQLRRQLTNTNYGRLHAYEQVSMPMMIADALSVTPRAGFGYTRYMDVDQPGDDFGRPILHLGLEASLKFNRDFDVLDHDLGIHGLKHVFQPYLGWSYIDADDWAIGDPAVDRLTPSTRPRPLDPMRYTATDQIQGWNVVRLGMRNRLITQRDHQSHEWLFLNTYIDAFGNDPEGTRDWSNLYNDLVWAPVPWMNVDLEAQTPITEGSGYTEYAASTRFMPSDVFEFELGYRWLNGHPFLPDSSRVRLRTYSRLTRDWGVGTRHDIELDDGVLEYQQYTVHRDLGQWVGGVGFTVRDNRLREEFGIVFLLTLKDFPSVSLPFEYDGE